MVHSQHFKTAMSWRGEACPPPHLTTKTNQLAISHIVDRNQRKLSVAWSKRASSSPKTDFLLSTDLFWKYFGGPVQEREKTQCLGSEWSALSAKLLKYEPRMSTWLMNHHMKVHNAVATTFFIRMLRRLHFGPKRATNPARCVTGLFHWWTLAFFLSFLWYESKTIEEYLYCVPMRRSEHQLQEWKPIRQRSFWGFLNWTSRSPNGGVKNFKKGIWEMITEGNFFGGVTAALRKDK